MITFIPSRRQIRPNIFSNKGGDGSVDFNSSINDASPGGVEDKIELPPTWFPLRYHPAHAAMWNTKKRFVAAVAGRSSGKTELARRKIVLSLAFKKEWPNPIYVYCLPTYNQARKVAWYPIISLLPREWIPKDGINKSESSITTIFGSTLYIVGMDKPHRIEGLHIDGVVIDESSDQKPELFRKTIMPMLTARNAWAWRIGVPKKSGVGRVDFRTFFEQGLEPDHPSIASFTWKSSEVLLPEQIEEAKRQLDPQEYSEQFDAQWVDAGGTIYYNFSKENISDAVRYIPGKPIIVGCDFNVSPMCWVLSHLHDGKLLVFDEIFLKDTNTVAVLNFLHEKYGILHTQSAAQYEEAQKIRKASKLKAQSVPTGKEGEIGGQWTFIGDASARARKTNATRTDYLIIKNDVRFGHKKVIFPQKNPHIRDRFACVNAAFRNAMGDLRILINPKCKHLINDLHTMSYVEGTTDVENYEGTDIGHMSDALGYIIFITMPIKMTRIYAPQVITQR